MTSSDSLKKYPMHKQVRKIINGDDRLLDTLLLTEIDAEFLQLKGAFNDRVKIIEMQLKDKKKLEAEISRLREALIECKAQCDEDLEALADEALSANQGEG